MHPGVVGCAGQPDDVPGIVDVPGDSVRSDPLFGCEPDTCCGMIIGVLHGELPPAHGLIPELTDPSRSQAQQQVLHGGWLGQERVVAGVEFDDGAGLAGELALKPRGVPLSCAQTR